MLLKDLVSMVRPNRSHTPLLARLLSCLLTCSQAVSLASFCCLLLAFFFLCLMRCFSLPPLSFISLVHSRVSVLCADIYAAVQIAHLHHPFIALHCLTSHSLLSFLHFFLLIFSFPSFLPLFISTQKLKVDPDVSKFLSGKDLLPVSSLGKGMCGETLLTVDKQGELWAVKSSMCSERIEAVPVTRTHKRALKRLTGTFTKHLRHSAKRHRRQTCIAMEHYTPHPTLRHLLEEYRIKNEHAVCTKLAQVMKLSPHKLPHVVHILGSWTIKQGLLGRTMGIQQMKV